MRLLTSLVTILLLWAAFAPTQAQEFEVTPDSTSGVGLPGETNIFRSLLVNLWDQENRVNWHLESDLPEGWAVQICQLSYTCWPSWTTDETMILGANAEDSLLVEFITNDSQGVGRATISMVAEANADFHRELTFELRVGDNGIGSGGGGHSRLEFAFYSRFMPGGTMGSTLSLPQDAEVTLALYDLSGRQAQVIWQEFFTAGEHFISLSNLDLPAGVYILRASCPLGAASQRVMVVR